MNLQKLYLLKKLSLIILISLFLFPILILGLLIGSVRSGSIGFVGFAIFVTIILSLLFLSLIVIFIVQNDKLSNTYTNLQLVFILAIIGALIIFIFIISFFYWIVVCIVTYSRVSQIINYEEQRNTEFTE
ncbi:hypothetical protein [Mesomycoplasma bovoculi]|uniref:Transmembrane protein n=1 Tax=Mesomycoplasma bovoculi M165/69 TaxID=743966 RepID=W5US46_9BACT|nr:hypothetical protein [Mesomycoplasma bovoculi]AHH45049.1 hypothetical protein MYB_00185 [Mesomycoplasma bovoculi M165/69]